MCRWAAWTGASVYLETVITEPAHSLVIQSREAEKCKTAINADGFGVAWYDSRPEPGLYRDVYPAWSDSNLASLCKQLKSHHFLAHVRASTGTAISRNNCHPFVVGRWSFIHNGQAGGYESFRKQADMLIPDALYGERKGATDSEAIFLIAHGFGLETDPVGAIEKAVGWMEAQAKAHSVKPHMRFAAALSDGNCLWAFRYASDDKAPTLFYRYDAKLEGYAIVSEPYEAEGDWVAVPSGHVCCFNDGDVAILPFVRKRYQACLSKCHGMSSSMRAAGWPCAMASSVALR